MGYTQMNFSGSIADFIKSEVNSSRGQVIKYHKEGEALYMAYKYNPEHEKAGQIVALVFLVHKRASSIMWKDMDENMNPYYYDCPISILNTLTPTNNKYALEWRVKCYEKNGVNMNQKTLF